MRICLAGNPNSGKTTLFNALTGARQRVGNWPGVTVEQKTGKCIYQRHCIYVVDLPGTYSLSVSSANGSIDERIACEFILSQEADIVVNILDAANLERNLYLTRELLEMQVPVIIAVNMMDIAKQRGIKIDCAALSLATGCPVVPIIARKGKGIEALQQAIINYPSVAHTPILLSFDATIAAKIAKIEALLTQDYCKSKSLCQASLRWLAVRLLENDYYIHTLFQDAQDLLQEVTQQQNLLETETSETPDILLADSRYRWIGSVIETVCQRQFISRRFLTESIDRIVLNRWLGIPIFLAVMYLMFEFSITLGGAFQPMFDQGSRALFIDGVNYLGNSMGLPLWITALFAQGIGLGLNTVLTFIPQIGALFLFLAFIEDSGYMTRAAFVMDRCMQAVGLPGKSFVPLIVGFGCNVPSIMATRTLEHRRDRLLTIMMAPFMSCGARLAIFAVFSSAFFPKGGALIVFLLYMIGIMVAVLTAFIAKYTILKGISAPFVTELPPYHLPSGRTLMLQTWQRLKGFVIRAGKIIVPICVLVGTLNAIDLDGTVNSEGSPNSILASVSRSITPIFHPMGISENNWQATVGLVTGTLAKEVVVGTLNTLYSQNQVSMTTATSFDLWRSLKNAATETYSSLTALSAASFANPFTANEAEHSMSGTAMGSMVLAFGSLAAAFAYMLFVLLYIPCVSTIAATTREAGSGWAWLSAWWSLSVAYVFAVIAYQALSFLKHPLSSSLWIMGMLAYLSLTIFALHYLSQTKALQGSMIPKHTPTRPCHS